MGKKDTKKDTNKKHNGSILYKIAVGLAFIFFKMIKPILREKNCIQIMRGLLSLMINPVGVVKLADQRYITSANGWEQLERLLKDKGYETQILFRDCEYWKINEQRRHLKGRNIGEYFILWEGDNI